MRTCSVFVLAKWSDIHKILQDVFANTLLVLLVHEIFFFSSSGEEQLLFVWLWEAEPLPILSTWQLHDNHSQTSSTESQQFSGRTWEWLGETHRSRKDSAYYRSKRNYNQTRNTNHSGANDPSIETTTTSENNVCSKIRYLVVDNSCTTANQVWQVYIIKHEFVSQCC